MDGRLGDQYREIPHFVNTFLLPVHGYLIRLSEETREARLARLSNLYNGLSTINSTQISQ